MKEILGVGQHKSRTGRLKIPQQALSAVQIFFAMPTLSAPGNQGDSRKRHLASPQKLCAFLLQETVGNKSFQRRRASLHPPYPGGGLSSGPPNARCEAPPCVLRRFPHSARRANVRASA